MGFGPPFLRLQHVDRLELNAHIGSLIESKGLDSHARGVVAEYGLTLPQVKAVELHGSITRPGGNMSGHTPEQGNVEVPGQSETKEFSRGAVRQRIGYYKIWREPAPK